MSFDKMNEEILNKHGQELFLDILKSIGSDDKLQEHSLEFAIILTRALNEFKNTLHESPSGWHHNEVAKIENKHQFDPNSEEKSTPEMHKSMIRRHTLDERGLYSAIVGTKSIGSGVTLPKNVERIAMKKRHSNVRKTIASRIEFVKNINDVLVCPKNTNREMYLKNNLFRTLCVLCNRNERHLVAHYSKEHPRYEVFVARPSPNVADKLRLQIAYFKLHNKKITGICVFCEESKNMSKYNWAAHLLTHTGENMYFCRVCYKSLKSKRDRKCCQMELDSIFNRNTSDDSLNGFICRDCNYIQISKERMVKHLVNEHKYHEVDDGIHFKLVVLVPDLTPIESVILWEHDFADVDERFKCTICLKQFQNLDEFEEHIDDEHQQNEPYLCFCDTEISKNGSILTGQMVSTHLQRHNADLYQCIVCKNIYFTRRTVQNHFLNEHAENQLKYLHSRREDKQIEICENEITNSECYNCKDEINSFAHAIEHFQKKHQSKTVQLAGRLRRKISRFTQKHNCDTEVKYFGFGVTF